jgi:prolyl 4-hydroxylase
MSAVVHFPPELRDWLVHNITRGAPAAPLIAAMTAQGFKNEIATALVGAFLSAASAGKPFPADSVEVDPSASDAYRYEEPRFASGNLIQAGGRSIRMIMRAACPTLAVFEDFLSSDECERLIASAKPRLAPSTITDPLTGKTIVSESRTSDGMFFRLGENPLIAQIERRIADLVRMPVENGEGLQVLNYQAGAQSSPHFDFLMPGNAENNASIARSGQRIGTLVMYLNDVQEGGGTGFPEVGLTIMPKKGSALYFEYCNSLNQLDGKSLHAGLPIVAGEKWVATKWIRQKTFLSAQRTM